ncbi:autotransporter outer membrane beta-barrel domain-containing protein, partial [Candidatus Ruminimicrobium bovinum]|uniref:autotransporter family protein n=1 Tax=Candidatus Ruminimicrobium bovinum TaxID=3242779 RepID=UPI0039B91D8F
IEVSSAVINYGNLKLTGDGENNVYTVGQGTITFTGQITNNNMLAQRYIVNEGTITTKLEQIYASDKILNNGKIVISETSQYHNNENNFEGTGTLEISTSILNSANIQQNSVLISTSVEFYTKSDLLDVANLNNNGFLIFSEDSKVNKSTITGSGFLYILSDVESTGGIEQYAIINRNNFTVDGNKFKANIVVNNGLITLSNGNVNFENTYLQGNGRIAGDVVIGSSSTLAPGNSIGAFYIRGNLTFDNNSAYEVEVNEDDSDYTRAYGNITINSGSKLEMNNIYGKFFEHKTYDILFTTSTLSGVFEEVNLSGYDVDVSTDLKESRIAFSTQTVDGAMQVTLSRKQTEYSTSSELSDLSVSQKAVAQAIDMISLKSNKGQTAKLLSELESYYYYNSTYNTDKIKDIFTSLSGTIYANNAIAPFLNSGYEHIYDKIYKTHEVKDYVDEYYVEGEEYYETKRNLWGQYFYNYYDVDGNRDYPGYTDSIDGFYAGYDVSSSKNKLLGIVAGYAHGKLKQKYDQTETQSINLGAYGAYNKNNIQLKSLLMLGYDTYNTDRQTKAKAEYNGYNIAFDVQGSYDVAIKENFILKPFVGILTDFITQDSFSETNAESLNLSVKQNSNFLAQARIGFDVTGKIKLLKWYAKFAIKQFLTQNYFDTKIKIEDTGTEFTLKGTELANTIFNIGFGGEYILSQYWTAFANIQAGIGTGKSNNYYGNIGVKYKFGTINKEEDYIIR